MIRLLYIDLFCGAGGTSTGVENARYAGEQCAKVIACVNHDVNAIASPAAIIHLSNTGGANKEIEIHPTQKPIALYHWVLKKFAKQGDKILDTHLGSGSSRIAAYKMGFDFYATEIDKDYFQAQEKRFKKECLGEIVTIKGVLVQKTLF